MISTISKMPQSVRQLCLSTLRHRPCAFCTDFDGTIAPISITPDAAQILPPIRHLLDQASDTFDVVAVISGRELGSLWQLVGIPNIIYIGDHGNQKWIPGQSPLPQAKVDEAVSHALGLFKANEISTIPGLEVELKGSTAAIHYRNTQNPPKVRQKLLETVSALSKNHDIRVGEGKAVVEIQSTQSKNKGDAIEYLYEHYALKSLFYLGDDKTDVDAFERIRQLRTNSDFSGIAVAIAHPEAPDILEQKADLTLASIDIVPSFIRWLISLNK